MLLCIQKKVKLTLDFFAFLHLVSMLILIFGLVIFKFFSNILIFFWFHF